MQTFSNPFVRLWRIRHRCGYGVHSPFAFRFITDVVYERLPFYAYDTLRTLLPFMHRWRKRMGWELFFRIANYQQPSVMAIDDREEMAVAYLHAGCRKAKVTKPSDDEAVELCYLSRPDDYAVTRMAQGGILILDDLQRHRAWFRALPATLYFDLYDLGIAFFDVPYYKQYYVVNF